MSNHIRRQDNKDERIKKIRTYKDNVKYEGNSLEETKEELPDSNCDLKATISDSGKNLSELLELIEYLSQKDKEIVRMNCRNEITKSQCLSYRFGLQNLIRKLKVENQDLLSGQEKN